MPRIRIVAITAFAALPWVACMLPLPAAAQPATAQAATDLRVPAGAVAAQIVGRLVVGFDGSAEVVGYFPTIAKIGAGLFVGAPGEAQALFTVRSSRARFGPTFQNGSLVHQLVLPQLGEPALLFGIYYDAAPSRDFSRPETFSSGRRVATFTLPQALVIRSSSSIAYTATLELTGAEDFEHGGRALNFSRFFDAITVHLSGTSPALSARLTNLAVPFGAAIIAVHRDALAGR